MATFGRSNDLQGAEFVEANLRGTGHRPAGFDPGNGRTVWNTRLGEVEFRNSWDLTKDMRLRGCLVRAVHQNVSQRAPLIGSYPAGA